MIQDLVIGLAAVAVAFTGIMLLCAGIGKLAGRFSRYNDTR